MSRTPRLVRVTGLLLMTAIAVPVVATPVPPVPERGASLGVDPIRTGGILPTGAARSVAVPDVARLTQALDAVDDNDLSRARELSADLTPLERDLVLWMAIRRDVSGLDPRSITDFALRHPNWPSAGVMRRRAEAALARADLPPEEIAKAFAGSTPVSDAGVQALVKALRALGRTDDARAALAPWWATAPLSPAEDARIVARFGDLLGPAEHRARYDMLMAEERFVQAEALARLVGEGFDAFARARAAAVRGDKSALKKLQALPPAIRREPLYALTIAEHWRRADKPKAAADALLSVDPPSTEATGDAWWVERRIVSRDLVERGDAETAYKLVAAHRGGDAETLAEAHFHAGWYALRFLNRPEQSIAHFKALQQIASKPLSRSRAAYWLGRAEEAAGRLADARRHYTIAAADEFTFYGQLARVKLGADSLDLPPEPTPTEDDRSAFARNDLVRALALLQAAGRRADAAVLYPELASQLPSGGQIALLAAHAAARGDHRMALQIGKVAADRGLGAERLAFPLDALPESARNQTEVETAMVYAIARQESAFDPAAVSKAGAKGLLQLLPGTAKAVAKDVGLAFDERKLTSDPAYNAALGAAHLRELVDDFEGSYILAFAAYNAGPRKATQWVQRFGDPRDPAVDPIDWIELIPYGETRNYVQRVTENIQVYRERLGPAKLRIAEDLRRGGES